MTSQDSCKRGHLYTEANTYIGPTAARGRTCRECGKASNLKYAKSAKGRLNALRVRTAFRLKYPAKHRAHVTLYRAVKSGEVIKPTICSINNESCRGRIEGHHQDYEKRLEVDWLCHYHHMEKHYDKVR